MSATTCAFTCRGPLSETVTYTVRLRTTGGLYFDASCSAGSRAWSGLTGRSWYSRDYPVYACDRGFTSGTVTAELLQESTSLYLAQDTATITGIPTPSPSPTFTPTGPSEPTNTPTVTPTPTTAVSEPCIDSNTTRRQSDSVPRQIEPPNTIGIGFSGLPMHMSPGTCVVVTVATTGDLVPGKHNYQVVIAGGRGLGVNADCSAIDRRFNNITESSFIRGIPIYACGEESNRVGLPGELAVSVRYGANTIADARQLTRVKYIQSASEPNRLIHPKVNYRHQDWNWQTRVCEGIDFGYSRSGHHSQESKGTMEDGTTYHTLASPYVFGGVGVKTSSGHTAKPFCAVGVVMSELSDPKTIRESGELFALLQDSRPGAPYDSGRHSCINATTCMWVSDGIFLTTINQDQAWIYGTHLFEDLHFDDVALKDAGGIKAGDVLTAVIPPPRD